MIRCRDLNLKAVHLEKENSETRWYASWIRCWPKKNRVSRAWVVLQFVESLHYPFMRALRGGRRFACGVGCHFLPFESHCHRRHRPGEARPTRPTTLKDGCPAQQRAASVSSFWRQYNSVNSTTRCYWLLMRLELKWRRGTVAGWAGSSRRDQSSGCYRLILLVLHHFPRAHAFIPWAAGRAYQIFLCVYYII